MKILAKLKELHSNFNDNDKLYSLYSSDDGRVENYIGCTKYFKKRYYGHRSDMNNPANKDKNRSTLANYVWKLKDERKNFDIKWKIIGKIPSMSMRQLIR